MCFFLILGYRSKQRYNLEISKLFVMIGLYKHLKFLFHLNQLAVIFPLKQSDGKVYNLHFKLPITKNLEYRYHHVVFSLIQVIKIY